jgi:hypothetical protein
MGINDGLVGGTIAGEVDGFFRLRVVFLLDFLVDVRRLFVGGIDKSIDFD